MKNSIVSECRTLICMKSVWILSLVTVLLVSALIVRFYSTSFPPLAESADGGMSSVNYADDSSVRDLLGQYHPVHALNNSLLYLLGFGSVTMPILSALYFGVEYSQKTIRLKAVSYVLVRTLFSKVIAAVLYLAAFCAAYLGVTLSLLYGCWKRYPADASAIYQPVPTEQPPLILALAFFFLLFILLLSAVATAACKSSVGGILATIAFNYLPLSNFLSPRTIMSKTITDFFYMTRTAPVWFSYPASIRFLPTAANFGILAAYFGLLLIAVRIVGRMQKN